MKFSACMLVCRSGDLMDRAFQSLLGQSPDEIRIYLDPVKLGNELDYVKTFLEKQDVKTFIQEVTPHFRDHHEDVVHAVHRAILEAEHKWVAWNDDDDEILGDRRQFLGYAKDDVGVIYGDVLARRNNHFNVRRTKQVHEPRNVHHIIGSGQIYNRDAFKQIHRLVDHGYWWDFKIFYWMLKVGYRAVYVPKLFSLQNVNVTPSQKRTTLRGKWVDTANNLDRQKLKLCVPTELDTISNEVNSFNECIVCGCTEATTIFTKKDADSKRTVPFVRCRGCGLIYVKDRNNCGFAPDNKLERNVFAKEKLAPGQQEPGHGLLKDILPFVENGKLLDIGCATGYRAAPFVEKGFDVYGVEPNRTSATWGAEHFDINMHIGYLDTVPWSENLFDVAVLTETIEHLHYPNYDLRLIRKLLKPDGLLFVKTGACQYNKNFGPDWRYCQPCEFYFFTLDLLIRLIQQNGFDIVHKKDLVDGKGGLRVWAKRSI